MMNVKLLAHTPDPERVVAMAGRLCYANCGIDELAEQMTDQAVVAMIEKLKGFGHLSTFEHASFSFGVEGISRVTSHQLVRHRIASYSQQSQRYVKNAQSFKTVLPPAIAAQPELAARVAAHHGATLALYAELEAAGIKGEDARYLLPNATATKILITMNARTLVETFFAERLCGRAQWEIRAMAEAMLALVRPVAPNLFANCGPGCVTGACPEGAMCCGRQAEMRARFGAGA